MTWCQALCPCTLAICTIAARCDCMRSEVTTSASSLPCRQMSPKMGCVTAGLVCARRPGLWSALRDLQGTPVRGDRPCNLPCHAWRCTDDERGGTPQREHKFHGHRGWWRRCMPSTLSLCGRPCPTAATASSGARSASPTESTCRCDGVQATC